MNENSISQRVKLMAVGDMLIHTEILKAAKQDNGYCFDWLFQHMKPVFQQADLVIANQETLLTDNTEPVGYHVFATPTALGDAEIKAGIGLVSLASNHTLDQDESGLAGTMAYWRTRPEMAITGISEREKALQPVIVEKNGVRIAFLNYTQPTNFHKNPKKGAYVVELLREDRKEEIKKQISVAREKADFTVVLAHWGVEYLYEPVESQKQWASVLAEAGADLIIGTHPHVVASQDTLSTADGRKVPCYYSLGNFVSCQKRPATMLGSLLEVCIEKEGDRAVIKSRELTPLVTHTDNKFSVFTVYPLKEYTDQLAQDNKIFSIVKEDYGVTTTKAYLEELFEKILNKQAQKDNPFQCRRQVLWYNIRRTIKNRLTGGKSAGRL